MNAQASPPRTPYEALGGSPAIEAIVNRFYDLMDTDPDYTQLRAMHQADLAPMRQSLAGWLSAWAGGPKDWFTQNPGKCIMSAHRNFAINSQTAGQWVDAMARAISECGPEDRKLGQMMAERLDMMAKAMVPEEPASRPEMG
ncbi:MAG: group II truncated hemoglobin [Sphingomonadaceae bacterium]